MKKIIFHILMVFCFFCLCINVYAQEYQLNTLIPVDSFASVKTEKFDYIDFIYDSSDAKISFSAIVNNTAVKNPVSINILLFDDKQENIGFLTYCSDKDVSSDYAGFKIGGGQSSAFKIDVTKRYFADNFDSSMVKYIAVMDENKYCHIGGYDNYKGLTINEIVDGNTSKGIKENKNIFSDINISFDRNIIFIILYLIISLVIFIIYASIINLLNKRMYAKGTILAYIPLINVFVAVKLAFGKIVTLIYLVLYLVSIALFLKVNFLLYIVSGFSGLAFIIDIIKLITKKYDLFYFEPAIKSSVVDNKSNVEINNNINNSINNSVNGNSNIADNSFNEQILDLSYDDEKEDSIKDNDVSNDLFNISSSEIQNMNMNNNIENNDNSDDSDDEDDVSDLSKLF